MEKENVLMKASGLCLAYNFNLRQSTNGRLFKIIDNYFSDEFDKMAKNIQKKFKDMNKKCPKELIQNVTLYPGYYHIKNHPLLAIRFISQTGKNKNGIPG